MLTLTETVRVAIAPQFWYGILSPRTVAEYLRAIVLYVEILGDLRLNELNGFNNARFVQALQRKNMAVPTICKHVTALNGIFLKLGPPGPRNRDALSWLPEAPWIRPPQEYKKLPREVFDDEIDRLFKACAVCPNCYLRPKYLDERLRPRWWESIILLAASTALRRGVLFGLTWEDLDIPGSRVIVPNTLDKKKRERVKPLHPKVLQHLRAVQSGTDRRLLPWSHGITVFGHDLTALNQTAGITHKITLHDIKRYAIQAAVRSGMDANTVMLLGDHSSFKTTQDHYARENLTRYVEKIWLPCMDEGVEHE